MSIEIPYHQSTIGQEEIDEVVECLRSGWLTSGPRTAEFERRFREYVGVPHALGVNSCTAGLHLALAAMKIGPGDEVITTPLTFCATVNVILHQGATPVLADVDQDGNIDPSSIEERITERTRAIIPVHLAGLPVDLQRIWELARRHRLSVIEDCAHAAGAQYQGWQIGAGNPETGYYSDACAFSFYATKNLTTGEGGMVTTHDKNIAERLKLLCLHGISKDAWMRYSDRGSWYYQVLEPGFKYNLSDLQSAIGMHQITRLNHFTQVRREHAALYNEILSGVEELERPSERTETRSAWHLYMLRLNTDQLAISRDEFILALREKGIGTSVHFIPISLHPFFQNYADRPQNQCPRALELYSRLVSLPLYPAMSASQVEYVAETVAELCRESRETNIVAISSGVR
jgi:dTDP-4-amino-4,6-dideoxygalactose transaminase